MDLLATVLAIIGLLGLNAFFVAAEFALISTRTRSHRLQELAAAGDKQAHIALRAIERLDDIVAATQVGTTFTSLALGWIGAVWCAPYIRLLFEALPTFFAPFFTYTATSVLIFTALIFVHVVLGEIVPKSIALSSSERISRLVAPPMLILAWLCQLIIRLMYGSARKFLALFSIIPPAHVERVHAPEELLFLLEESHEHGLVEESDAEMIAGVLDLSRTSVREVMTPRTEICAVEQNWPLDKILEVARLRGFSRLPVYEEDIDHISGILLVKDLLAFFDDRTHFSAASVMRNALFTSPTMAVDDLMQELQQRNAHMAIVVDEYGGTLGLITLEDLIEEIVGEIFDEFDHTDVDAAVRVTADGHLSVPGDLPIEELNDRYNLRLSAGDYITVAGLVLSGFGQIPSVGQHITVDDVTFHVTAMDRQRIERLEIVLPDISEKTPSSAPDALA
jgi:CBS domain containing-hemolysin-like protein